MKDPELYDFFKKGSEAFDEMPSADLWGKIDAGLKEGKKAKSAQSLLIKILLLLAAAALTAWIYFELTKENSAFPKEIKNTIPLIEIKTETADTLRKVDSINESQMLQENPKAIISKPKITAAAPEVQVVEENELYAWPATKSEDPVNQNEVIAAKKEDIAETTVFKNRIVMRTTKKLTDAQYDELIANAIEKSKDNYGMMLIVIASGRPAYRKVIPGNKLKVETTVKKVGWDTAQYTKLTGTNEIYFDAIVKNQQNLDVRPDFPGGINAFYDFVQKNFHTPDEDVSGKIMVQFTVEIDGSLSDITVLKDLGHGTKEEAIRVFKSSPKWIPGYLKGKPVRVLYSVPIMIKAQQ
ncbi:energy transducer TonB [Flavobacterium sp. 3HN19-14]|uniref:energy transducer TonB n=1 Tax=Flavobacterium sp. 3HN19-14 TaxID=3448133 RepID=UPI003EE06FBA